MTPQKEPMRTTTSDLTASTTCTREMSDAILFPEKFSTKERQFIKRRRLMANPDSGALTHPDDGEPRLGLALSGGGIRSATFCLGVLQSMARSGLLRMADYLSTVSGGGYIGGFLGTLFVRQGLDGTKRALSDSQSTEIRWLRENGRYLAPNGDGDLLTALAVQFRNWLAVVFMMSLFAVTAFLGAHVVRMLTKDWWERPLFATMLALPADGKIWWWSPWLVATFIVALLAVAFAWAYWLVASPTQRGLARYLSKIAMVVGLALVAAIGRSPCDPRALLSWANWQSLLTGDRTAAYSAISKAVLELGLVTATISLLMWLGSLIALERGRIETPDVPAGQPPEGRWRKIFRAVVIDRSRNLFHRMRGQSAASDKTVVDPKDVAQWMRDHHSAGLRICLAVAGVLLLFALLDSLGQTLYLGISLGGLKTTLGVIGTGSGLGFVFSLGDKLSSWVKRFSGGKSPKPSIELMALLVGILFFLIFLLNCNILAHACAWKFQEPIGNTVPDGACLWMMFVGGLVLSWLFGRDLGFLNASSLQSLYGARLVRAYLGASNPLRQPPQEVAVTETIAGDDLWLTDYAPHDRGGPLHIINSTFNETCSAKSQLEQHDRKGLPVAVGPVGITVGARFHALWSEGNRGSAIVPIPVGDPKRDFQMFPLPRSWRIAHLFSGFARKERKVQRLPLGRWIGISGAAVSTGMGQNTSLGFSLLTGLANVRLGYWWDSRIKPVERGWRWWSRSPLSGLFPTQSYLLDEWLARFHGPARRHWNLSDGGHFENTAVYELLRRRVPYIICCDCGADPDYDFTDMANLVRKARIDFGAEIRLVLKDKLRSACPQIPEEVLQHFGMPETFDKGRKKGRQPHALLAVAQFPTKETNTFDFSLMLFLKPSLSGDEPLDLWEYDVHRKEFPQESTADQFFDEAQWESYRKLGEHIAESLLTGERVPPWFTELSPETVWQQASQNGTSPSGCRP